MNKKELSEIKKHFDVDCGYFTVNRIVTALVDSQKVIKCKENKAFFTISEEDSEQDMINLKKVLSGQIGKTEKEYAFPKEAYEDGGAQKWLYDTLVNKFEDEDITQAFLERIADELAYTDSYVVIAAHCTYNVFTKRKDDTADEDSELTYNYIVTAICPVTSRFDGLVYNKEDNNISKKASIDRIVELPTDGFLFPVFSDRTPDINSVLCYSKSAKKPNASLVESLLGCSFIMSSEAEKEKFISIINDVAGDELNIDVVTSINEQIQNYVAQNVMETEIPTIDEQKLEFILEEAGISQEKLNSLSDIYKKEMGGETFTANNLIEKKTVIEVPSITVNINNGAENKVSTQTVNGKKCLVIELDEKNVAVNGLSCEL